MMAEELEIRIEDLPDELAGIADEIGLDAVLELVKARGGETIYICKWERVERASRDRSIREMFDGANYRELVQKYNLTQSRVRQILEEGGNRPRTDGKKEPRQQQLSMF